MLLGLPPFNSFLHGIVLNQSKPNDMYLYDLDESISIRVLKTGTRPCQTCIEAIYSRHNKDGFPIMKLVHFTMLRLQTSEIPCADLPHHYFH